MLICNLFFIDHSLLETLPNVHVGCEVESSQPESTGTIPKDLWTRSNESEYMDEVDDEIRLII